MNFTATLHRLVFELEEIYLRYRKKIGNTRPWFNEDWNPLPQTLVGVSAYNGFLFWMDATGKSVKYHGPWQLWNGIVH
jgi:hypothetical protein